MHWVILDSEGFLRLCETYLMCFDGMNIYYCGVRRF